MDPDPSDYGPDDSAAFVDVVDVTDMSVDPGPLTSVGFSDATTPVTDENCSAGACETWCICA